MYSLDRLYAIVENFKIYEPLHIKHYDPCNDKILGVPKENIEFDIQNVIWNHWRPKKLLKKKDN